MVQKLFQHPPHCHLATIKKQMLTISICTTFTNFDYNIAEPNCRFKKIASNLGALSLSRMGHCELSMDSFLTISLFSMYQMNLAVTQLVIGPLGATISVNTFPLYEIVPHASCSYYYY